MRNIIQTLYAIRKQAYLSDVLGLRNLGAVGALVPTSETRDTR